MSVNGLSFNVSGSVDRDRKGISIHLIPQTEAGIISAIIRKETLVPLPAITTITDMPKEIAAGCKKFEVDDLMQQIRDLKQVAMNLSIKFQRTDSEGMKDIIRSIIDTDVGALPLAMMTTGALLVKDSAKHEKKDNQLAFLDVYSQHLLRSKDLLAFCPQSSPSNHDPKSIALSSEQTLVVWKQLSNETQLVFNCYAELTYQHAHEVINVLYKYLHKAAYKRSLIPSVIFSDLLDLLYREKYV